MRALQAQPLRQGERALTRDREPGAAGLTRPTFHVKQKGITMIETNATRIMDELLDAAVELIKVEDKLDDLIPEFIDIAAGTTGLTAEELDDIRYEYESLTRRVQAVRELHGRIGPLLMKAGERKP